MPRVPRSEPQSSRLPVTRSRDAAVVLCFFLSGVASLILEVTWTRWLRLVFGSTTLAVSTTLVAYMLGLGLGGLTGGRWAARWRNGLRAYGWIEIGIAVYALCVPWILDVFPVLNRTLLASLSFWPAAMVRFTLVLVALLPPTLLMGATLPILTGALTRSDREAASRVGLLYGLNTLGAVTGVFVATFVLFPRFGATYTNGSAALLDLFVGILALVVLAPRFADATLQPATADSRPVTLSPARWSWPLLAYGLVGFTALIYEVSWTRALSMILGSSIYAFATMLAAFLTGIALGSLVVRRRVVGWQRPLAVYAIGIGALGAGGVVTMLALYILPDLFVGVIAYLGRSPGALVTINVTLALLVMLAPTVVLGALFPLLITTLGADDRRMSALVGDVYFVNTVGSAAGALAAGFVLIPLLSLRGTLVLAAALNLVSAAGLLFWQSQWRGRNRNVVAGLAIVAAIAIIMIPPAWNEEGLTRGVYRWLDQNTDSDLVKLPLLGIPENKILYYRDGINTSVSVHRTLGQTSLKVNGKVDAGSGDDMSTQILLGEVPMLFGPHAEGVLVIGLGSGVTAGSVALHEPARVDVVELEPAILDASHFFDEYNHRPLERANVRVIADDARTYLAQQRELYDVIISEPSNPWITGAASLFTREFFHSARQALRPGGRFCQWLQLYEIDPATLHAVLAAFHAEFPAIYAFADKAGHADLLLLGMQQPLSDHDLPEWNSLRDVVRDDLRRSNTYSSADILSLMQMQPADVDAIVGQATAINTDDSMLVELRLPWMLDQASASENWRHLDPFRHGIEPPDDLEQLGALALAYAGPRADAQTANALLRMARERGDSVHALVAEVVLKLRDDPNSAAEALSQLDAAVARGPQFFAPWYYRARMLQGAKQFTAALDDIDAALRIWPGDWRARYLRLQLLAVLGRSVEARQEAEALLATPYAQVESGLWAHAAYVAAAVGQLDTACAELHHYLETTPDSYVEWSTLAGWYDQLGNQQRAADTRTNVQHAAHNVAVTLHRQARRWARANNMDAAVTQLTNALLIDPSYDLAREELEQLGVAAEAAPAASPPTPRPLAGPG